MNAQEAIEKIEKRYNEEIMQTAAYEVDMNRDPFTLEYLINKDKALSIVLTMAKEYYELMISDENMKRVHLTGKDTGDAMKRMFKSMEGADG